MTIDNVIGELIDRRLKLIHLGDGKLDVRGPKAALTADLLDGIRQHKAELLRRMARVERETPDMAGQLEALVGFDQRPIPDQAPEPAPVIAPGWERFQTPYERGWVLSKGRRELERFGLL